MHGSTLDDIYNAEVVKRILIPHRIFEQEMRFGWTFRALQKLRSHRVNHTHRH